MAVTLNKVPREKHMNRFSSRLRWTSSTLSIVAATVVSVAQLCPAEENLALVGRDGTARNWEPGVPTICGQEPDKANDGSFHTYWMVRAESLPADLGVEWAEARRIASVIVRYFDGRMVRGPAVARTQQWARLQCWQNSEWNDLDAEVLGQETSVVRYVFLPVTTSRIRLLFTEPPDPEARRSPDRLGIYVCELEAFEDVPFQWVSSPNRLTGAARRGPPYNEPPTGDCGLDVVGALIIEPKQTRIFTDTLTPTLIVSESRWANEPCLVEQPDPNTCRLRNGFVQLELSTSAVLKETSVVNRVTGDAVSTPGSRLFLIRTDDRELTSADFKLRRMDAAGSDDQCCRVRFELTSENLDAAIHYELRRQDHFYHKWLTLSNKAGSDLLVRDVVVSSLGLPRPVGLMAGAELTYPVSTLEKGGFFSCLETVYWEHRGDTLVYFPAAAVKPGQTFESERAVVGVFKKRGETVAGWDRGVREWVVEYHAQVSPLPEAWPDVYCEAWSAKFGIREIRERPEWSERFMATAQKLGIRYMDLFEPTHEAAAMPAEWVKRAVDLAQRHAIGTGFWTDFGSGGDFYGGLGVNLGPHRCKLSPEAEAYFKRMVELTRAHQFKALHWGDFLAVWPCSEAGHGHLPGKYSIYAQGQRMLRFRQELKEASPGIMLGADGGFTNPQYVRHEDSRAHGIFYGGIDGDHWSCVEPDIHLDRLYAGMNRAWVVGGYWVFLRPWFRMINCVNHFGQETHRHDRAGFRYGMLSAIAMAAQVTFNDVPVDMPESEIEFARRWLSWARENKDYLRQGDKLFDRSLHFADVWQGNAEALSGFAHIRKDRGHVFLLNPSPVEQIADLTLSLDVSASERLTVEEVYPGGMTLQGPADGMYLNGEKLRVTVPAKQVRILWIAPASSSGRSAPVQPENARVAEYRRYVGKWEITEKTSEFARLRARFTFPNGGERFLSPAVPESAWSEEPWAYDKAYMVFLLKDELEELNNNWVSDHLSVPGASGGRLTVTLNGVSKTARPFKTKRFQRGGVTRCFFADLGEEVKLDQSNAVEVVLPIQSGLVFSGAYIDLPDQMP